MKTLVFSDLHLTEQFCEKEFIFLTQLIQSVDHVIINGDFWDGYLTAFDAFIKSPWKRLFPLLKAKNCIYIQGNHDKKIFCDEKANLFSVEQKTIHSMKDGSKTFVFEHGNRLFPSFDEVFNPPKSILYVTTLLYSVIEKMIIRLFHRSPRFWGILLNKKLKKNMLKNEDFHVFGHTHFAEFDLKNKFVNTGFIQHGLAQYIIIEDGTITQKQEWYK